MNKTKIELDDNQAISIFKSTDDSGLKQMLKANFPKLFRKNILEWDDITFNDICIMNGTTEKEFNAMWYDVRSMLKEKYNFDLSISAIAYEKLQMITKTLNTDEDGNVWIPDADSTTEKRHYPYFYFSPFRFFVTNFFYVDTFAFCGVRLCVKSESVAKFFGTHFVNEWNEFLKK